VLAKFPAKSLQHRWIVLSMSIHACHPTPKALPLQTGRYPEGGEGLASNFGLGTRASRPHIH
jgi:hypothetical protein